MSIQDEGIGIPYKNQEKIKLLFDSIDQTEIQTAINMNKMTNSGFSIGLLITKMIVNYMGGYIELQSQ